MRPLWPAAKAKSRSFGGFSPGRGLRRPHALRRYFLARIGL
jgi:hypothetical protein